MQDEQQFEQLMMQYQQLKNGAEDISRMIDNELFDDAITMIKSREEVFLSCKCMRNYLEFTPVQQKEADKILDEIRELELANIKKLEKGMDEIQRELKLSQKSQKLQQAYNGGTDDYGSIINTAE
jgi:hypothetical protein